MLVLLSPPRWHLHSRSHRGLPEPLAKIRLFSVTCAKEATGKARADGTVRHWNVDGVQIQLLRLSGHSDIRMFGRCNASEERTLKTNANEGVCMRAISRARCDSDSRYSTVKFPLPSHYSHQPLFPGVPRKGANLGVGQDWVGQPARLEPKVQ